MNERDFTNWLDGFLFARESYGEGLDKTDVGYIRYQLDKVNKEKTK
jgi:hypothetical protein